MREPILDRASRIAAWVAVAVAAVSLALGAAFWIQDRGRDLGGVVGLVFLAGGGWLLLEALPHTRRRKR